MIASCAKVSREIFYVSHGAIDRIKFTQKRILSKSINEEDNIQENFKIYPNPTTDYLDIDLSGFDVDKKIIIRLVNKKNEVLISEERINNGINRILDIRELPNQLYFLQIYQDNKEKHQKILKF